MCARPSLRQRPDGVDDAFRPVAYSPAGSSIRYLIPPTLASDYERFLMTEIPGVNYTFEVVRDWYDRERPGYEPEFIRATYIPLAWKSKISNSDMGSNFFADTNVDVKKGDLLIREDGEIYVLDWKVQRRPNVQTSQAKDCNVQMEIYRDVDEVVDDLGYVVSPARRALVIPPIPCVWTSHTGRPEFSVAYNAPGLHADELLDGWVQWNNTTRHIRIGDEFIWGTSTYRIINMLLSEVDMLGEYGLINLNARRVAGGTADA